MSDCKSPCEGCAFSPGAAANKELTNHLRGLICLLGPIPFLCHDGQDWKAPENHQRPPGEFFRDGWEICQGWKREVGKLAETGYYDKNVEVTKALAQAALQELQIVTNNQVDEEDRAGAEGKLAKFLAWLYRKHATFTGVDLGQKTAELAESRYFTEKEGECSKQVSQT